jgi:circadian clock protein KaiB
MNDYDQDLDDWEKDEKTIYHLQLFVAGTSSLSVRAINNLNLILAEHLEGNFELDIIDVYQQPQLAIEENVAAVPMLVKKNPEPVRRLIGDMSDTAKVLRGLGVK